MIGIDQSPPAAVCINTTPPAPANRPASEASSSSVTTVEPWPSPRGSTPSTTADNRVVVVPAPVDACPPLLAVPADRNTATCAPAASPCGYWPGFTAREATTRPAGGNAASPTRLRVNKVPGSSGTTAVRPPTADACDTGINPRLG